MLLYTDRHFFQAFQDHQIWQNMCLQLCVVKGHVDLDSANHRARCASSLSNFFQGMEDFRWHGDFFLVDSVDPVET